MTQQTPQLAMSHVGLFVSDLPAMEAFYTAVLGLTVTDRGDLGDIQALFLSRDPTEHHQIAMVTGRPENLKFTTINQISLRADELETLRKVYTRAEEAGATDIASVSHGNAISVYFNDPEGNRVEVFIDTPWYVNQPMREPIDLNRLDEDIWKIVELRARELTGFRPREVWLNEMRALMSDNQL